MEDKFKEILDDYYNCSDISKCDKCKASQLIEIGKSTTYCRFLLDHRNRMEDYLIQAIEKAM